MIILDGKLVSDKIKEEIKISVSSMVEQGNTPPHLAVILVGNHPASSAYVNSKIKACKAVGFKSTLIELSETTSEEILLEKIQELNGDRGLDGFMVQLPLPEHVNEQRVLMAINPLKDVDGFHPENFGKMALELPCFIPATPFGILELLKRYDVETKGKYVVVVGRSNIVGKPISLLLGSKRKVGNSTVTTVHSHTKNLKNITLQADIIIIAMGIPEFLTGDMIKDGVTVIDVGINRVDDNTNSKGYKIVGDADFESIKKKCAYLSPVPGGVGPMTIAMLLKNTLLAKAQNFNVQ